MLNNNRTVLVVIVLFAIAGLSVGGYFAWRLDIFGLFETQVKGEIEVVKTVNETEREKLPRKKLLMRTSLPRLKSNKNPMVRKKKESKYTTRST